ncbi:hypothetical protein BC941DRAFT_445163, partial [Chlamydoabsidia padenii]
MKLLSIILFGVPVAMAASGDYIIVWGNEEQTATAKFGECFPLDKAPNEGYGPSYAFILETATCGYYNDPNCSDVKIAPVTRSYGYETLETFTGYLKCTL